MTQNFSIFKNGKKENEKQPDYKISAKLEGDVDYKEIGGCWLKDGKSGKFFSCRLNKPFNGGKVYKIVEMEEVLNNIITEIEQDKKLDTFNLPVDSIDSSNIPF